MKNAIAMFVVGAAMIAGAAKADPRADKLFAAARHHEEAAHKEREAATKLYHKAHEDLIKANRNDFEAHIEVSRALAINKSDAAFANKVKAHNLRHEAKVLSHRAHHHMIRAHEEKHEAAIQTHYAHEMTRAAGVVKDAPDVAKHLTDAAARHTAEAAKLTAAATKQEGEAKADHEHATKLWADAKALDAANTPATVAALPVAPAAPAPAAIPAVATP